MAESNNGLAMDSQFLGYQRRPISNRFDGYRRPVVRSTQTRPRGLIDDVSPPPKQPQAVQQPTLSDIQLQSAPIVQKRQVLSAATLTLGVSKSAVLARQSLKAPEITKKSKFKRSRTQILLIALAVFLFLGGGLISIMGLKADHEAQVQATKLTAVANSASKNPGQSDTPSTVPPSSKAVTNYVVAPTHPRYLIIPKLKVKSRVLSVGETSNGNLGTPSNIYDTAWYNESALPGQPGAVLIDGHVSSWTSHGVFYGLKTLAPGDMISIQTGAGTIYNYKVVKTVVYKTNAVDMNAAISPVVPSKPGLNLITCTGDVIPGTSRFNERMIVFTEQV
ncbi:MAG TPA: class F sortase [Candidatus Saccharimonadales bacterium]